MTIRQQQVIQRLPKNKYNISKSLREAGYTEYSSKAGHQIARIRNVAIKAGILPSKQDIADNFILNRSTALKLKDLSNHNRANEALARCQGMFTDNIKADINDTRSDDILKKHRLGVIV